MGQLSQDIIIRSSKVEKRNSKKRKKIRTRYKSEINVFETKIDGLNLMTHLCKNGILRI